MTPSPLFSVCTRACAPRPAVRGYASAHTPRARVSALSERQAPRSASERCRHVHTSRGRPQPHGGAVSHLTKYQPSAPRSVR
eukprot:scaffold5440_cov88-Isochrysis_galbana.AAC.4